MLLDYGIQVMLYTACSYCLQEVVCTEQPYMLYNIAMTPLRSIFLCLLQEITVF